MTRHCSLRDISQGGAYIETDHQVSMGETITLSLSSPALRSTCFIDATVVRKDRSGIGIRFLLSGSHQRQMIQNLIDSSLISQETQAESAQGMTLAS
jgi:hypothetical protein